MVQSGACKAHRENALPEREPTAYQLFGLLSACGPHGIKRVLRVTKGAGGLLPRDHFKKFRCHTKIRLPKS